MPASSSPISCCDAHRRRVDSAIAAQDNDGAANTFYFERPTPGAPNVTPGATELLETPQFSVAGGFFTTNVLLSMTVTNLGASIRFGKRAGWSRRPNSQGTGSGR